MTFPNYEGYEQLSGFTPGQLQSYRNMLLEKTRPQVDFILRHIPNRPLSVFEIGAGNGRLLIGLASRAQNGRAVLRFGYGMELSGSRVEFANAWKSEWAKQLQYSALNFRQGDALSIPWVEVDLAVCITGCFQYFYPADPEASRKLLRLMRSSGDYALFELYRKPPMGRTWHRLPEGDPWAYILDDYTDTGDWVTHTKTFIGRDGREDTRVENLAYYEMPVFLRHLRNAGFTEVHWAKQNSQSMVVLVS